MLLFCTISPEGDCMDGQACGKFCLHRHAGIRRATDSEQLCCELFGSLGREVPVHGEEENAFYLQSEGW